MSVVHAQIYVRESHLRVEARLPRCFTNQDFTLEIAPATRRERLVGDLCSIRHDARWTFGSSSGPAVVDLVPAGSELTELIVQTYDEAGSRRRSGSQRQAVLRRFVAAVRGAVVDERSAVPEPRPVAATKRPWRTPA